MRFSLNKNNILLIPAILIFITLCSVSVSQGREPVLTGLDVLEAENFKRLEGRKVGLITNHSALNNKGVHILDLFLKQNSCELKAIFTPEHGLAGLEDRENLPSGEYKGIPVHSLYGKKRKPTAEALKGIDILVFDIQDIGTRFYTYISTMGLCMEAAQDNGKTFMVLDRPNPITGSIVEGEVHDLRYKSFTGYFAIPTRHGMTVAEIANYYKGEKLKKLKLEIVKMSSWSRNMWYDETGLKWVNPSPNMRSLEAAILYPGLGMLEAVNISVGRGTKEPFIRYGAPWLDAESLVDKLNRHNFPGLKFETISFKPKAYIYEGKKVNGFRVKITDRDKVKSTDALVFTLYYIRKQQKNGLKLKAKGIKYSFGSDLIDKMLRGDISPEEIMRRLQAHQEKFNLVREKYLLY